MNWNPEQMQNLQWNGEIKNREEKERVAQKVASKAEDGQVIGFGSGSTSLLAVYAIAERVQKENLRITAIPTSQEWRSPVPL